MRFVILAAGVPLDTSRHHTVRMARQEDSSEPWTRDLLRGQLFPRPPMGIWCGGMTKSSGESD
jgi:hypothetical protein